MNFLSRLKNWFQGLETNRFLEGIIRKLESSRVIQIAGCCRSSECGKLALALAVAQGKMEAPVKNQIAKVWGKAKDGTPIEYSYKYADLADVIESAKQPLAVNGLAYIQALQYDGTVARVVTELMHESGQWLRVSLTYPCPVGKVQDLGTIATYLKRYALGALLGIAAEEDTDGQRPELGTSDGQPKKRSANPVRQQMAEQHPDDLVTREQVQAFYKEFWALASTKFTDKGAAKKWLQEQVGDISQAQRKKLNPLIQAVKQMPVLGEQANTSLQIEEDARPGMQRRWAMCVEKKGLTIEEASWWAQHKCGWIFDPVKGRASASLTPLQQVKDACWALEKFRQPEIDKIKQAYAYALDDSRLE